MKILPLIIAFIIAAAAPLIAQEGSAEERIERGFDMFDADADSALSSAEFKLLGEFSPKLKDQPLVVAYLFRKLDANNDGKLSHDEYMGLAKLGPKPPDSPPPSPAPEAPTAKPPTADELAFFEKKIRPVLAERCYKCHAADSEKIRGGLLLDTREGIRKGGDTGPAVVAGDVSHSLIIEALNYANKDMQMPPEKSGGKLSDTVIADFTAWIKMGAPDPREGSSLAAVKPTDYTEAKQHWAYQPVKQSPLPKVSNEAWARGDIDRFILAGLDAKGIQPVGDASKTALLRRVTFDLTGLPPTPEQTQAFLQSAIRNPQSAIETVVDALLKSPRFGERWGRHWLDVARYAESTGRDVNCTLPHAWRYRDYVIDAFNADKPFDTFIQEQIAGDLLPAKDSRERAEKLIATGFLAIGSRSLNERNPKQFALDMADEQIDALSQSVLGITIACARCHDHKFDPITQRDYYALAGILLSTETLYGTAATFQNAHPAGMIDLPTDCGLPRVNLKLSTEDRAEKESELAKSKRYGDMLLPSVLALYRYSNGAGNALNNDPKKLIQVVGVSAKIKAAELELATFDAEGWPKLMAIGARDYPAKATPKPFRMPREIGDIMDSVNRRPSDQSAINDSPLYARGDVAKPGEKVARGFPSIVGGAGTSALPSNESGRRELAAWLTSKDNVLTARVITNRVWYWLFGRGIVESVDNFGVMGQAPANPALLDHLALKFSKNGWSVKQLIRSIVLSHAYQLATTYEKTAFEDDPENTLVWRMTPRRLEAECIRDAMLAISGSLQITPPTASAVALLGDRTIGGLVIPTMTPPLSDETFLTASGTTRSVYLPVPRDAVPDVLSVFDFAEQSMVAGKREVTTVPSQALYLLNNDFVAQQARRFADRVLALPAATQITSAFELAFARSPTEHERQQALSFFNDATSGSAVERATWTSFCRALFCSAEFRLMD